MTAIANALAESFVDSFKTELIRDRVWHSNTKLELAIRVRGVVQHPPAAQLDRQPAACRAPSRLAGTVRLTTDSVLWVAGAGDPERRPAGYGPSGVVSDPR